MNRLLICTILLAGLAAGDLLAAGAPAYNANAVIPSQRRLKSLEAAHQLLIAPEPTWTERIKNLPDPFYRDSFVPDEEKVVEATPAASNRSDRDILAGIASRINPTGTLQVGDGHYLLVDGRRLTEGDAISMSFEGAVYRITITSVKRNSYTLRLNDEELRREFK